MCNHCLAIKGYSKNSLQSCFSTSDLFFKRFCMHVLFMAENNLQSVDPEIKKDRSCGVTCKKCSNSGKKTILEINFLRIKIYEQFSNYSQFFTSHVLLT